MSINTRIGKGFHRVFSHPYFDPDTSSETPVELHTSDGNKLYDLLWSATVLILTGGIIFELISANENDVLYLSGDPLFCGGVMISFAFVSLVVNGRWYAKRFVGIILVLPAVLCFVYVTGTAIGSYVLIPTEYMNEYFTFIYEVLLLLGGGFLTLTVAYWGSITLGMVAREVYVPLWNREPEYVHRQAAFNHAVHPRDWRKIQDKPRIE